MPVPVFFISAHFLTGLFGSGLLSLISTFLQNFIYLFISHAHTNTNTQREREGQREREAPCREPNVGLNPRTPGSLPEPKADAQPLSHPGVPNKFFVHLGY